MKGQAPLHNSSLLSNHFFPPFQLPHFFHIRYALQLFMRQLPLEVRCLSFSLVSLITITAVEFENNITANCLKLFFQSFICRYKYKREIRPKINCEFTLSLCSLEIRVLKIVRISCKKFVGFSVLHTKMKFPNMQRNIH